MYRLQIYQIVNNKRAPLTIPPSYIRVCAVVWACSKGQTDIQTHIQTRVTIIHFMSSMTHEKRNNYTKWKDHKGQTCEKKLNMVIVQTRLIEVQCIHTALVDFMFSIQCQAISKSHAATCTLCEENRIFWSSS